MKVLVTGACGFIGSHLVDMLIRKNYEVVATDLSSAPKDFLNPKALFIPADLSEEKDMKELFLRPEVREAKTVFHLGAIFDFFPFWDVMYKNNVLGTKNLCGNFSGIPGKKRMILFSSGVVTGKILSKSNYGYSKLCQETMFKNYSIGLRRDFESVIVRPAAVIGPRSRYGAAKIIEMIAGGQMQFFIGKKNLIALMVHVKDVVRATVRLAEARWCDIRVASRLEIPVFDLVDDSNYSYEELILFTAAFLEKTHGVKIINFHLPVRLAGLLAKWQEFLARRLNIRPKLTLGMLDFFREEMRMDNSAIKKLGFKFEYSDSKDAISDAVRWYLKKGWL